MSIKTNKRDPKIGIVTPGHVDALPRAHMYRKLAFGSVEGSFPIHVDRNDLQTQVDGLTHRVGRTVPSHNANFLAKFKSFVAKWLDKNLTPIGQQPAFEDWLDGTSYPQDRKEDLRKTYQGLAGGMPSRKARRKVASFIKTECYPQFKHARWINSRSDAFKVYSGPWFHEMEKQLFKLPWFIKYVPVPERAALIAQLKKDGLRYFGTDFESFEAHFTPKVMDAAELALYRHMLKRFPEVSKLICSTIAGTNHGRTRLGVSFFLKGRRMSGDMCTSLGNGFTNLMLWLFIASEHKFSIEGFVEGDDGIFAASANAPSCAELAEEFKNLGFTIKIEEHPDPKEMSFCGIIAADGQNIRDPSDVLQSFGWSHSCIYSGERVQLQLLRAKALSLAYELPNCPILRAVADRALELTTGVEPRFELDGYHAPPPKCDPPKFEPTDETRFCFARKYAILPTEQLKLEQDIRTCVSLDFLSFYLKPHSDQFRFGKLYLDIG